MKKVLMSISMIVMLVVMSCSTAFADETEPVEANSGEHKTVDGNVKVSGDESVAVSVEADIDDASATVTGDVSVNSTGTAKGVNVFEGEGKATATIGGSVTAKGENTSMGVQVAGGNVEIGKNVTVEGPAAIGAGVASWESAILKIGGDVSVTSTATAERELSSMGLMLMTEGGKITVDIAGDLLVKTANGTAIGILNINYGSVTQASEANVSTLIHGSVIADGYGIMSRNRGLTEILIENELKAKEVGILLASPSTGDGVVVPGTSAEGLKLTVWKIQLNSRGNVAEYQPDMGTLPIGDDMGLHDVNPTEVSYKAATDFEKSIMYIIKYEQPKKGGKISAVDANGNPLAKSFGFDVAREGDKVFLKTALKKGYKLVAAYNGAGEKVALLKDANGNYYYVVPKGGGVYLSVKLQKKAVKKKKTTPAPVYYGSSTADVQGVKTGDSAQTNLWYLLLFASIICFGVVKTRVRREEA